ncbi:hypothetical protein B0T20DRAFT_413146 [Sordaria brevicollis]|uniref:Uncharacterized protein n=1 Tax=Sordaria brevicollis TaxID=83679 RepID=A0AAE0PD97_SORBR|nr:hypothetical protein B0T20DRAFT_413146 [Sordaria brevicollis]
MACTPIPNFRHIGRGTGKKKPRQLETGKRRCTSVPPTLPSPFPTKHDVFHRCNIPDPLRSHPPFSDAASLIETPKDFTDNVDTAEPEQATYEAYSAAFHAGALVDQKTTKNDHQEDSSDSRSFWLSSSSSSSSAHLPESSSSSSASSSVTLSLPATLFHPHYRSPTGLSIVARIRTHLCLPSDLPPSHLIVHLIRRWERARVAVAQRNAELAAEANALDWNGVEDEEAAEFLTYEERHVLNTWAEAQRDMENRRLCPLFGAWGYTPNAM